MTCDQFDELWQRLDMDVPGANPLAAGLLTAAELNAFVEHSSTCKRCYDKCEERWKTVVPSPVLNKGAAEMLTELGERSRYDPEL